MITPVEYKDVASMFISYREVSARLNPVKRVPITALKNENENEDEDELAPPSPKEDRAVEFLREVKRLPPAVIKTRLSSIRVCEIVAAYYGMSYADMMTGKRVQPKSLYRQVAMYVARSTMAATYAIIGRGMRGYNHSTILHGFEKVRGLRKNDHRIKEDTDNILAYVRDNYVTITRT